jgi:hypothetical protein
MSDNIHETEFPFKEIRNENGDFFNSWMEAKLAGFQDTQIWSVTESDGTWCYGPPHHYVNRIGYIATAEHHDNNTYYLEPDHCAECGQTLDSCICEVDEDWWSWA